MKIQKLKTHILVLLTCVCLIEMLCGMPTEAGSSKLMVNKNSFATELDTSLWNVSDNRVYAKDGKIEFSKESKSSTSIIAKTIIKNTGYHEELVSLDTVMDLRGIPENKTFAVALGLGGIEASLGEPGNVEIQFTKNNKLKISLVVYDENGMKTEVVAPQTAGTESNVKVMATISSEGIMSLSLNGKQIHNGKIPVTGEGRVGFLQDGSCAVKIEDVNIVAHRYDRPENSNIYEDFEKESININELTAKMVYVTGHYVPYGMEIIESDGNRVMQFKNMSLAYLGTMHQYSNFELTFDVINLQRESEMNEEGTVLVPKNENIVVSFGDEATDYTGWGFDTSPDAVVFDAGSQVYSMNLGQVAQAGEMGYDFGDAKCNRDFTIRVSVIDGMVTASLKWLDEKEFTEILKYKVSDITPLGYVHIWGSGTYTNFSIDNVCLVNKDLDPNLIELEFESAVYEIPDDFVYEKIGYVYRDSAEEVENSISPYWSIPIVAGVCIVIFMIFFIVQRKKEGRRKNEDA